LKKNWIHYQLKLYYDRAYYLLHVEVYPFFIVNVLAKVVWERMR